MSHLLKFKCYKYSELILKEHNHSAIQRIYLKHLETLCKGEKKKQNLQKIQKVQNAQSLRFILHKMEGNMA